MSYDTRIATTRAFGGFGYESLSGTFPVQKVSSKVRDLQEDLQRIGYMQGGSGIYGADGRFGPRTATALRAAARYVGWSDAPYSPTNAAELRSGEVTIPDPLIELINSASPNPNAPYAEGRSGAEDDVPAEMPAPTPTLTTSAPRDAGGTGWVPAAIISAGVLAVGGFLIYSQRKKKPVRNRRKRRRTSRR